MSIELKKVEVKMICFVILHYQNIEITQQCVNHLKNLERIDKQKVIIVDNGSPNHSGIELKSMYEKEEWIEVVVSEENLGFARGNNIGYKIAKEKYEANIIIVMNSDVYITDKNFITNLGQNYGNNLDVAILAPDILNEKNIHCNPMMYPPIPEKFFNIAYKKFLLKYILYSIPFLNRLLLKRSASKKIECRMDRDGWEQQQKDIIPEGSCVVFLKKWIQNEDFAFLPITFLYTEEFILWEYLQIKGYSSLYDPILQVHHIGGATTNELLKTNVPKAIRNKRRSLKWHMDSCKSYLKYKKKIEKMKRN